MSLLSVYESERLVESLVLVDVSQVGSRQWAAQSDAVQRLNAQAHLDAVTHHDEYIVDCVLLHDKLPVLVHQLLTMEAFHGSVVPHLTPLLSPLQQLRLYLLLFHQATLCNFIECLLYHPSLLLHASDDVLIELTDYCHRRVVQLHTAGPPAATGEDTGEGEGEGVRLARQMRDIEFACGACAVSILRYVTDALDQLPLSVSARLLHGHDLLALTIPLLLTSPFTRHNKPASTTQPNSSSSSKARASRALTSTEKWVDQRWTAVAEGDEAVVTRTEGQLWLTVFNLALSRVSRSQYHWTSVRQQAALRLRPLFTEALIDQLPVLSSLRRFVEEMGVVAPAAPTAAAVAIEVVPDMREAIVHGRHWPAVAEANLRACFSQSQDDEREEIRGMADAWGTAGGLGGGGVPVCVECGAEADKRCSLCAEVWYCGRDCQVKGWKAHRPLCEARREERRKKEAERAKKDEERALEKAREQRELDSERSKGWKQNAVKRPLIDIVGP